MNETLKALLNYSKQTEIDFTWRGVAEALAPIIYSDSMRLVDVISIVTRELETLVAEERFCVSSFQASLREVMLAPTKVYNGLVPVRLETQMTMEEFYNHILAHMMYQFRFARVDWCKEELE